MAGMTAFEWGIVFIVGLVVLAAVDDIGKFFRRRYEQKQREKD